MNLTSNFQPCKTLVNPGKDHIKVKRAWWTWFVCSVLLPCTLASKTKKHSLAQSCSVLQNFKLSPWWPPNQGEHLIIWLSIMNFLNMVIIFGFLVGHLLQRNFTMVAKQACFTGCAQTLPDATPPTGKIHPFRKMAVNFKLVMRFGCPSGFRIS